MAVVGYFTPAGAAGYDVSVKVLVGILFLLLGLTLNLQELQAGSLAWHFHVHLQFFSLVLTPALYYALVYHWGWEVNSGILSQPLAMGSMAACCMPTTAATSLVFVLQAGGDASVAAFNMAFAQIVGVAVAPVTVSLLIGATGRTNLPKAMWKMTYTILLPLLGGVMLQLLVSRKLGTDRAWRALRRLRLLNILCMVALFYFIFVKAFKDSGVWAGIEPDSHRLISLALSHSLTLPHILSHTLTLTLTLSPSLSLIHTLSLCPLILSLSHTQRDSSRRRAC